MCAFKECALRTELALRPVINSALGVNANGAHITCRRVHMHFSWYAAWLCLVRPSVLIVDVSGAPFGMRIMWHTCGCSWCYSARLLRCPVHVRGPYVLML